VVATIDFTLDDFRQLIQEEVQPMVDRLDQRIDRLETKMDRRFDVVELRLERLEGRVDRLEERLETHARTAAQTYEALGRQMAHLQAAS